MGNHEDLNQWLDEVTVVLAQYQAWKIELDKAREVYELPSTSLVCKQSNHDYCHPVVWGCHCECHIKLNPPMLNPGLDLDIFGPQFPEF